MLTLHRNLGPLTAVCEKDGNARFNGTCNLQLSGMGMERYRVEATNGRILAIVTGPNDGELVKGDGSPAEDLIKAEKVLVPQRLWLDMMKAAERKDKTIKVEVREHDLTAGVNGHSVTGLLAEGRYPNVNQVLPGEGPAFTVKLDPAYLITLLKVAQALAADSDTKGVDLHYWAPDKPIALTYKNEHGQVLDALLVPLTR